MRAVVSLLAEHLAPALIVGGLSWWWFSDWRLVPIALVTGWLIDSDHLVDFGYFLLRRGSTAGALPMLTTGAYFKANGKIIVPLHSWELAILWGFAWAIAGEPGIAMSGSLAWAVHLLQDQRKYGVTPLGYLFSYRAGRGFAAAGFCDT